MNQDIKRIINAVLELPQFPLAVWSCSDDAGGTAITLSRQKRWIVERLKEKFSKASDHPVTTVPDIEDLRASLGRLVRSVDDQAYKEDYTQALQEAKRLLGPALFVKSEKAPPQDQAILDDCTQAAKFYCATMFGRNSGEIAEELYRRFIKDDVANPLMVLFGEYREKYTNVSQDGFVQLPIEPTEEMWDGLPRHLIQWLRSDLRVTPKSLFEYLRLIGWPIPQWLNDELKDVPPLNALAKGTIVVLIYKAVIHNYDPAAHTRRLQTSPLNKAVPCTCLSELAHDAYSPGGPMSGHPLPPPCQLHAL